MDEKPPRLSKVAVVHGDVVLQLGDALVAAWDRVLEEYTTRRGAGISYAEGLWACQRFYLRAVEGILREVGLPEQYAANTYNGIGHAFWGLSIAAIRAAAGHPAPPTETGYRPRACEHHPERRERLVGLCGDCLEAESQRLYLAQEGRCAICTQALGPPGAGGLDYDYAAERRRALLCIRCHEVLQFTINDPGLLRAAADYLDRYRQA